MAIDGFFIEKLTEELNNILSSNRLERIFQIDNNLFVFNFYYRKKRTHLAFKMQGPKAGVFVLDEFMNTKQFNTNFLQNLKRELEGAILNKIKQHNNDRVMIFVFEVNDFLDGKVNKYLFLELMGRNTNLILTDNNNVIIDAHNKSVNDYRSIIPNAKFEFFPSDKKLLKEVNFKELSSSNFLFKNYIGVSPLLSRYIYNNNVNVFKVELNPTKDLTNNKVYWFDVFGENVDKKNFNSLSELLNDVSDITIEDKFDKQKSFIDEQLKRIKKRINILCKEKDKAQSNLINQHIGNMIYSSGLNLKERVESITDFDNNTYQIDQTKTLNENAQIHYKSYQKARRTITSVDKLIKKLREDIDVLEEISFFLTLNDVDIVDIEEQLSSFGYNKPTKKVKKTNNKQSNPLKIFYMDTYIYVGKNSRQNDYITHSLANKEDYWLHVKDAPGSHVIIKSNAPSKEVIELAAMLAAYHSKLKLSNQIPVTFTKVKNLRKIPGRPGSQVIVSSYESILINIDNEIIEDILNKANDLQ